MRTIAVLFLALGGIFALSLLILPAMGNHTEKIYTRIYVEWYEERRLEAIRGDLQQAAQSLKSVVEYKPLKVRPEGDPGRVLQLVRQGAIREIIARLRIQSGEDLGDDPEAWLKKYYRDGAARPNQQGAANGSEPVRPETNQTPAAAGSRR